MHRLIVSKSARLVNEKNAIISPARPAPDLLQITPDHFSPARATRMLHQPNGFELEVFGKPLALAHGSPP